MYKIVCSVCAVINGTRMASEPLIVEAIFSFKGNNNDEVSVLDLLLVLWKIIQCKYAGFIRNLLLSYTRVSLK